MGEMLCVLMDGEWSAYSSQSGHLIFDMSETALKVTTEKKGLQTPFARMRIS